MKRNLIRLFVLCLMLGGALLSVNAASADTEGFLFIVNTTITDGYDGTCNAAECALPEAILAANALAGKDTIQFNIPANTDAGCVPVSGICTIQPRTALPEITDPIVINGYSQPGALPNTLAMGDDAQIKIVIKGPGFHEQDNAFGLSVKTENSTIKGLSIVDFTWLISVEGENVQILGNFLGLLPDGVTTGYVVDAVNCTGCVFGKSGPENRNLVFGGGSFYQSTVQGNYFRTDKSGNAKADSNLVAADTQIAIDGATIVGGRTKAMGNVFGNVKPLVGLGHYGAILFRSNKIGVGADGTTNLGALFQPGSPHGLGFLGNLIANTSALGGWNSGVWFSRNKIYDNDGPGIDRGALGVTANDAGDSDGIQNYPVLTKVERNILGTTINGKLSSNGNRTYRIEFFAGSDCDISGYGEGKNYLGEKVVTIPYGQDSVSFVFTTPKQMLKGKPATATATRLDANGNPVETSEFSKCKNAK